MKEVKVCSLNSFLDNLNIYAPIGNNSKNFYFRGQSEQYEYTLPSIYRKKNLLNNEDILFKNFLMNDPELFTSFGGANTDFDRLALMQHHGLPTRLLDLTRNPLIALYFATESTGDCCKNGEVLLFSNKINKSRLSTKKNNDQLALEIIKKLIKKSNNSLPLKVEKSAFSDQVAVESSMVRLSKKDKSEIVKKINELYKTFSKHQIEDFEKTVERTSKLNEFDKITSVKHLYHEISRDTPNFEKSIDPFAFILPKIVQPRIIDDRIKNQQGLFLLTPFVNYEKSFDKKKKIVQGRIDTLRVTDTEKKELVTFIIPNTSKNEIQKELARFGITEDFVYPDHSHIADNIKNSIS